MKFDFHQTIKGFLLWEFAIPFPPDPGSGDWVCVRLHANQSKLHIILGTKPGWAGFAAASLPDLVTQAYYLGRAVFGVVLWVAFWIPGVALLW
jgi:hypothetical protein